MTGQTPNPVRAELVEASFFLSSAALDEKAALRQAQGERS
jgi:hypothetical protein